MTEDADTIVQSDAVVAVGSDWEDPPRAAPRMTAPMLSVEGFEGPLDWLLEMVRTHRIDLARLSIRALIEAFADALEAAFDRRTGAGSGSLAQWGDWLVMATTLAQLRSRLLLPVHEPEAKAARSAAEALRRQVLSLAHVHAAADWLERRPQLGRDLFVRGVPEMNAPGPIRGGDVTELLRACLVALRVPAQAAADLSRAIPFWRVQDAIDRIQTLLGGLPGGGTMAVFLPEIDDAAPDRALRSRGALAGTLVASLELARLGDVELAQNEAWGQVHVQRSGTPAGRDNAEQAV